MIPVIRAAGVRIWGGYLATQGWLGLATTWTRSDFDIVRQLGALPIGFCSGWDDPVAIRDLSAAWGVRACVDVEPGIRPDGPWVQSWLDESGAGLYGLAEVHAGRRAAFHVMAAYPYSSPAPATWAPGLARPAGPCGWQCRGTHTEFGISVDSGWYDDWFGAGPAPAPRRIRPVGDQVEWVRDDSGTIIVIDHLNGTYRDSPPAWQVHQALCAQDGRAPWAQVSDAEMEQIIAGLTQIGVPPKA